MQWWVSWLTWFQRFSILLHLIFAYFWWKKVQISSANQEIQVKNDAFFFLNWMFKIFFPLLLLYQHHEKSLTLKRLGGGQFDPPVVFPNMYLLERSGFLWLLILSELISFLKISLKFLKSLRRYDQTESQPEKNYSQKAHSY